MTEDEERRTGVGAFAPSGTETRPPLLPADEHGIALPESTKEPRLGSPEADVPSDATTNEMRPDAASHSGETASTAQVSSSAHEPDTGSAGDNAGYAGPFTASSLGGHADAALGSGSASSGGVSGADPQRHGGAVPALLGIVIVILLAALGYLIFSQPDAARTEALGSDLSATKARIAALEGRPEVATGLKGRLDATDAEVATLKSTLAAMQAKVGAGVAEAASAPDVGTDVAALDRKVADLARDFASVRTAVANLPKPDDTAIKAQLDAVDARLKPLEADQAAAKAPGRVTEMRQNGTAAETRAAPLAVTAQAVSRAIEVGRPFASDVSVLQSLGAEPSLLQPLQAVAVDGAPSLSDLRNDLANLRDRMVASGTAAPSGSYVDRLLAGASTLVQVRPLGSIAGDTPAAVVARMDAAIGADDLDTALADWQKLPEAARVVSKGLVDRIRLRAAAEGAARTIATKAIGAMATTLP